ncbi:uncharacterized ABC transporter permease protein YufP [Arthrobacter sp. Hiyo8]|nr:uncharacterized ABC transporter permease protein YufP [Arthrobacter sp. Hiyo8]
MTIMLNYIANFLLLFLLTTPAFQRKGSTNPISPFLDQSALFPELLGPQFRLHAGFLLAVLATVFVWWLLKRSTLGFEFRAVGANQSAARTAGINVPRAVILVMAIAGALAGLAGIAQVSGTEKYLSGGVAASIGFDAITVALLGRSTPWGTFFAGLLFGAFRAGGVAMQAETQTPIDIVLVIQSLIVLFIAAPPLVRAIFGLNPRKKKKATGGPAPEPSPPEKSRAELQQHEHHNNSARRWHTRRQRPGEPGKTGATELVSWKAGIGLSLLAILGTVLFGFMSNSKSAGFGIAEAANEAASSVAALVTFVLALLLSAGLGYLWFVRRRSGRASVSGTVPGWLPASTVAAVVVLGLAALGVAKVSKVTLPSAAIGWIAAVILLGLAGYTVYLTQAKRAVPAGWAAPLPPCSSSGSWSGSWLAEMAMSRRSPSPD